jgi:hypothetical protein
MFSLKVIRKKQSYFFKHNQKKNDFKNNIKNNTLDRIELYFNNKLIFQAKAQTVSNHPHYDFYDTIKKGTFKIKCFVNPRKFHGQIHGIIDAMDIENQPIDHWSMQVENGYQKGRWLIHDRWSFAKNRDLYNAYSGGCFIMSSKDLEKFNKHLTENGISKGDVIKGTLMEEE